MLNSVVIDRTAGHNEPFSLLGTVALSRPASWQPRVSQDKTASEVLDVAAAIYDCASDPAQWPRTLERVCQYTGASGAILSVTSLAKQEHKAVAAWSADPARAGDVLLKGLDARQMASSLGVAKAAAVIGFAETFGADTLYQNAAVKEFLLRHKASDAALVMLNHAKDALISILLIRGFDKGLFDDTSLSKIRLIAPHLRRAPAIENAFNTEASKTQTLSNALDLMATGVVLMDNTCKIVYTNQAAEEMLKGNSPMAKINGMLQTRDGKAAVQLRDAIQKAAANTCAGHVVSLYVGRDERAFALRIVGLGGSAQCGGGIASVAIYMQELEETQTTAADLFSGRFGASAAESRVAELLAQGNDLVEIGETLGISKNTVKTHLGHLFQKTGVNTQAGLVRLAHSAPMPVRVQAKANNESAARRSAAF